MQATPIVTYIIICNDEKINKKTLKPLIFQRFHNFLSLHITGMQDIWALTAGMFSLETYTNQKQRGFEQFPEIIQIDYLLMYTWSAVQSVGARFRLFFDKKT